jgi:hypothetical protein
MFLYQLVNLVLETCFIFSKTLNLSKTCFVLNFSSSSISQITSIMISLFQIIFRNSVQESVVSWIFLQSQLWCQSWIFFWHISFRKMFELLTCKNKSWLLSLRCHVVNRLKVDRHGWGLLLSLAMFEEKSPFKVGCHVGNVTWLSLLFLLRFFLFCFGEKKNLSPNFGVIVFFLDLVDFQSTGSWDFSSLLLTRGP